MHFKNVNLKSLYFFVKVVQSGGFSQAQKVLNASAASISGHVSSLEKDLGYRLCVRGRSGFSLTDNGKIIYEKSLRLLENNNDFWHSVHELKGILHGTISIGCMDMTLNDSNNKITYVIQEIYNNTNNDADINLEFMPSPNLEYSVLNGDLDMAICFSNQPHCSLDYRVLYEENLYLYCSQSHPLFGQDDNCITDEILQKQSYSERSYPNRFLKKFTPKVIGYSNSMEGHLSYIISGIAIGFLPEQVVKTYNCNQTMRAIKPDHYHIKIPIYLVTPKIKKKTRLVDYVIKTIESLYV